MTTLSGTTVARFLQSLPLVLVAMTLGLVIYAPPAAAELVGTGDALAALQARGDRDRVKALVARPELAKQLQVLGISPENAQARVDALTNQEIHTLAGKLDTLPAGGNFSDFQWIMIIIGIVIVALLV